MKTAKVLHHQSSSSIPFNMSLERIAKKIERGATMLHFLPREGSTHQFVSLKVRAGRTEKAYFFDPTPELLTLPHEKVQQ